MRRFHLEQRDRTLVVEKIPEDRLSPDAVHGWFERFGTVTNVVVDATSAKALVSLSTPKEAHAAWKTEGAIFGNRFFRVFWHGGPRSLRGSALSASRGLCADSHTLHSRVTHHALTPLAHTLSGTPSEEHRPRRRTPNHRLRVVLMSNRRRSPVEPGLQTRGAMRRSRSMARASRSTGTGLAPCLLSAISCIIIPDRMSCFFSYLHTTSMRYLMLLGCLID